MEKQQPFLSLAPAISPASQRPAFLHYAFCILTLLPAVFERESACILHFAFCILTRRR
jgi:hypothetical protein